jgi:hypothetical protein
VFNLYIKKSLVLNFILDNKSFITVMLSATLPSVRMQYVVILGVVAPL